MRPSHPETLHWTPGGWARDQGPAGHGRGVEMVGCQVGLGGMIGSRAGVQEGVLMKNLYINHESR